MTRLPSLPLTRRQALAASVGGSLAGTGWATAFRTVTAGDDTPLVTIARTRGSIAMLVELRGRRVLVLQSEADYDIERLTELVTGLMKPRVDLVLGTSAAVRALPLGWVDRWRVQAVLALPDGAGNAGPALASGHRVAFGEVTIRASALPLNAWRVAEADPREAWAATIARGNACVTLASDAAAAERLPLETDVARIVVCNDETSQPERVPAPALAIPVEADGPARVDQRILRLGRSAPVTLRLTPDAIELPGERTT